MLTGLDGRPAPRNCPAPRPSPTPCCGARRCPRRRSLADLPKNVQSQLTEYRERERAFRSAITPPPDATEEERETYDRRVGIERVVFCLFPRGDSAKVAPQYALDADIEPDWQGMPEMPRREAKFIDRLLADLPKPWLAPYLNLVAGHRKLCASEMDGAAADDRSRAMTDDARRQLAQGARWRQPADSRRR